MGVQANGDRRHAREQHARDAEEQDRSDHGVGARAGVPLDHELEHVLVEERDREHSDAAEQDDGHEQPRLRNLVGEHAARPVADRQAGQHDSDQGAPHEERAAEERREDAAGRDLHPEQDGARHEDGEGECSCSRSHSR
jgi:hypothetical protein